MMRGLHSNRTRGRKARREGGGNQDNLETDSLFVASPSTTRTLTECLGSHTNAFLLSAKGRGFSFLDLERNQDKVLFSERIRKIFFLLSAKGSENGRGNFPSFPLHPKTPHTPANVIFRTSGTTAPLSKGAKGIRQQAEKRDGGGASIHQKTRRRS